MLNKKKDYYLAYMAPFYIKIKIINSFRLVGLADKFLWAFSGLAFCVIGFLHSELEINFPGLFIGSVS